MIQSEKNPSRLASEDMALDFDCIGSLSKLSKPTLRTYKWEKKAITYGYFIDPEQYIDCEVATKMGFDIAKRPTGGGLLFHTADYGFTFSCPRCDPRYSTDMLTTYQYVNQALLRAVEKLGYTNDIQLCSDSDDKGFSDLCMATPTKYDIIYRGKKIGGSSQRKTKHGFIHQSSLFLIPTNWDEILLFSRFTKEEVASMQARSASLFQESLSDSIVQSVRDSITSAFLDQLQKN